MKEKLATQQDIVLRDFKLEDLESYSSYLKPGNPWQHLDAPYFKKQTPSEVDEMIATLRGRIERNEFPNPRTRLVITDRKTDQLIGTVSSYWESIETHWLCAGIILFDESRWGKGLGVQALTLWIDYLFESHPQIARLDMRTWSGNTGMMALAKKLGFKEEARFRNARIVNGEYFDSLGFGILREEWRKHSS